MGFGRNLDKLFGGERGAAEKTLAAFKRTYGAKDGKTMFDAQVIKRQRRAKRQQPRRRK